MFFLKILHIFQCRHIFHANSTFVKVLCLFLNTVILGTSRKCVSEMTSLAAFIATRIMKNMHLI